MTRFQTVLIEHGYADSNRLRKNIESAGGTLIDAQEQPIEQALKLCQDADCILFRRMEITREIIQSFKRCRLLLRFGVGIDNVDLDAATAAGIIVCNITGYCIDEVSNQTIALLMTCIRRILPTHNNLRSGGWCVKRLLPIQRTRGKILGIVGLGSIGQLVAQKLDGWGLNLIAVDPYVEQETADRLNVRLVDLDTLSQEADYISLHVPLLPETYHLFNEQRLFSLKPGTVIVNTARGALIDTEALIKALDCGQVESAGLDVFEQEPLPPDAPIRTHPGVVLSDHMGWYSEESQEQIQEIAADTIVQVCRGDLPTWLANPEVIKQSGLWNDWTPAPFMQWQLKRLKLV
jgi:D-3-phosphoglycerate dehydrogenase / 2-oxoglutarate reductase